MCNLDVEKGFAAHVKLPVNRDLAGMEAIMLADGAPNVAFVLFASCFEIHHLTYDSHLRAGSVMSIGYTHITVWKFNRL